MNLSSLFRKRNSTKNYTDFNQNLAQSLKKSQKICFKKKCANFFKNTPKRFAKHIATALIYALIFSAPIYLNIFTYLNIDSQSKQITAYLPYLNTIFALFAVASALKIDRKYRFFFGFFVGILWFYWTNLSFRFTPSPYLMWVGIIGVAIGYAIVFYFLLFFNNKIFRIATLAAIGLIPILGFDWLVVESLFSFSILRVDKISFIFIMVCVAICLHFWQKMRKSNERESKKKNRKMAIFALFALVFAIDFSDVKVEMPQKIFIVEMNIAQGNKWSEYDSAIARNLRYINEGIEMGANAVILPETAFPMRINQKGREYLMEQLLDLSHQITIITGAQRGGHTANGTRATFNSVFVFEKGQWQYADKIFLAPFGEYAPVPKVFAEIFKKLFKIDITRGFDKSENAHNDIETENFSFRSAICYEATTRRAFDGDPKLMIAITNSAWFAPSIEPVLQMMLMKYYARIHKTIIMQSANGSKSVIITPNVSLKFIGRD